MQMRIKLLTIRFNVVVVSAFQIYQTYEEQAKHNVSKVAEQMVEIPDCSKRFETEMVLVAEIMVACLLIVIAQVHHC